VQEWLEGHFQEIDAISQVVKLSGIPERTLKCRFKMAAGSTLIEYLQNKNRGGEAATRNQPDAGRRHQRPGGLRRRFVLPLVIQKADRAYAP
jgi:hypothetical protein